jgi:exopolysaccharide production protein ExoZ
MKYTIPPEPVQDQSFIRKSESVRFRGIQVLRIFAALIVLTMHSAFYTSERLVKQVPVWRSGAWGVDIFFVISGFVMVCSYARLFGRPDGWKVFVARRVERIVPMYWLATTVKIIIMLSTAGLVLHSQLSLSKTVYSYLFLPAYTMGDKIMPVLGVGWTLNFEMFFYFLFALALLFQIDVYKFVGTVLTLAAIGSIFRRDSWPAVSFYLDPMGLEFLFGMLIARICLAGKSLRPRYSVPILVFGLAVLFFPRENWSPRLVQVGIPAALIVAAAAWLEPYLLAVPAWILFLSEASYVIYLFHPIVAPIAPAVFAHFQVFNPILSIIASICLGLLVPSLVYKFVDAPVTRYFKSRSRKA